RRGGGVTDPRRRRRARRRRVGGHRRARGGDGGAVRAAGRRGAVGAHAAELRHRDRAALRAGAPDGAADDRGGGAGRTAAVLHGTRVGAARPGPRGGRAEPAQHRRPARHRALLDRQPPLLRHAVRALADDHRAGRRAARALPGRRGRGAGPHVGGAARRLPQLLDGEVPAQRPAAGHLRQPPPRPGVDDVGQHPPVPRAHLGPLRGVARRGGGAHRPPRPPGRRRHLAGDHRRHRRPHPPVRLVHRRRRHRSALAAVRRHPLPPRHRGREGPGRRRGRPRGRPAPHPVRTGL
ncbi:MAG: hypothetical protein AVDCRST_MAG35-2240, partial [uncultured Quadrisphaera sp.]